MTDFVKGQQVSLSKGTEGCRLNNWDYLDHFKRLTKGKTFVVTRVNRNKIVLRDSGGSYSVARDAIEAPNGEFWTEPDPVITRKIGVMPEGSLSPDDPRLQWLWEDAAKVAKNHGLCDDYDRLAERLGIPGRVRLISIEKNINGVKIKTDIKARSKKEALEILESKVLSKS